jgi:hypothetical protein
MYYLERPTSIKDICGLKEPKRNCKGKQRPGVMKPRVTKEGAREDGTG